jgi:transcriptional regulator with XRE-family HTH domain
MPNERLRNRIAAAGLALADVAAHVQVDPKTVERWITKDRVPHRTHRWKTAELLDTDETYLWPTVADDLRTTAASQAEFVTLYPSRGAVPEQLWSALLENAQSNVDVLAYAGLFLADGRPDLSNILSTKAGEGASVRLLFGDPDSEAVRCRGDEEGIEDGMAARVRLVLTYLSDLLNAPDVGVRVHRTTLYNSIYRFDDDMLVNAHVYGAPAAQNPVMHLQRVPGGRLFGHYLKSFDKVWESAQPVDVSGAP